MTSIEELYAARRACEVARYSATLLAEEATKRVEALDATIAQLRSCEQAATMPGVLSLRLLAVELPAAPWLGQRAHNALNSYESARHRIDFLLLDKQPEGV